MEHFVISKTSALIKGDNWMFIILLLQCYKGKSNTHTAVHSDTVVIAVATHFY